MTLKPTSSSFNIFYINGIIVFDDDQNIIIKIEMLTEVDNATKMKVLKAYEKTIEMKWAFVTHNHPKNETEYTLSSDDVKFLRIITFRNYVGWTMFMNMN